MPQLRYDPITRQWVIIAPDRGRRPPAQRTVRRESAPEHCAFCSGHDDHLTKIIREIVFCHPDGGAREWLLRVVPNRVPALVVEGDLRRTAKGVYDRISGIGAHEIVIEGRDHRQHPADMSSAMLEKLIGIWCERMDDLMRDIRLRYVQIFKNYGMIGGETVSHPHSQIIATPVIPPRVEQELVSMQAHYLAKERCLVCDVIEQELADGERVVTVNEDFVAICPYASPTPFDLSILPRRHQHDMRDIDARQTRNLALLLKDLFQRLRRGLADPTFTLTLRTAPNPKAESVSAFDARLIGRFAHWRLDLTPHPPLVGGFEQGTGMWINPTAPEDAAGFLRDAIPDAQR
jgi:UDPglucose--hexose-1-phosphate uridylyltransferase